MGAKNYETPPEFFRARWELHRFNVDAAASDENALVRDCGRSFLIVSSCSDCEEGSWQRKSGPGDFCNWHDYVPDAHAIGRYYTEETNGLDPEHYREGDRVWCNAPYDASIIRWVKLARELSMDGGVLWELLLPASTDTRWFQDHLWNDEAGHWRDGVDAHFIGRVQFLLGGQPIRSKAGKIASSRQANLLVTLKARKGAGR